MKTHDVGSLIIHEDGHIKGIVTEQDIVRKAVFGEIPAHTHISAIMTTQVIDIAPDKDIYEAILMMRDNDIRTLPVKEGKKLVGLITLKDILKIEPQLFDLIIDSLEVREESRKPIYEKIATEDICELCGELSRVQKKKNSRVCKACAPLA